MLRNANGRGAKPNTNIGGNFTWLSWLLLGWFSLSLAVANQSMAQVMPSAANPATQTLIQLPSPGATPPLNRPTHGVTMQVGTPWNERTGYLPVYFVLNRVGSIASDMTVTLHLKSYDQYRYYGPFGSDDDVGTHIWQDIEIPAGEMQAETTLALLQMDEGGYSWEVYVDGELAEELAGDHSHYYVYNQYNGYSGLASILLMASPSNAQTIADLTICLNPNSTQVQIDEILDRAKSNHWVGSTELEGGLRQLPAASFPQRAIDYNSIDIIYLTIDQLRQLTQEKATWRAAKDWIAAGGNLWIVGGGDQWEHLSEVEKAFSWPTEPDDPLTRGWFGLESDREQVIGAAAWNALEIDHEARADALLAQQSNHLTPDTTSPDATDSSSTPGSALQVDPPKMLWHGYMLGQVGVFAAEQPFAENPALGGPGMALTRRFPINQLIGWRESWIMRHGMGLGGDNEGFWNWLVPGVGLAPVTMFQIMITLFVLVIGPLNFILLRRWKRPYFMIVTVPLAAGLITAGLFAYAFATDGFSTRVRVRSFTELDQTTGIAATWARLSYYSGLAPSDGLRFDKDIIVLPIEPEERNPYYGSGRRHDQLLEIHWGDSQQYLKGDWLPSRTPVQYTTIRTRKSPLRLEVKEDSQGVTVQNKLQANILQVLVCCEDGKFYWSDQITPAASKVLSEIEFSLAQSELATTLHTNAPSYPPGWAHSHYISHNALGEWRHTGEESAGTGEVQNSLLEVALARIVATDSKSPDSIYGPGRYIAIVDHSPEVALGLEQIEQQSSVQVITGCWK